MKKTAFGRFFVVRYLIIANDSHYYLLGPPGGGACHGAGAARKKASFCIFIGHHHLYILLIINGCLFFVCRIECFLFDIERVFLKLFARCMFKALRRKYGS